MNATSVHRGNTGRSRCASFWPSGDWNRSSGLRRGGSSRMRRQNGDGDGASDSFRAPGDIYTLDRGGLILCEVLS